MNMQDYLDTKIVNPNTHLVKPGVNYRIRFSHTAKTRRVKGKILKVGISGRLNDHTKGVDLLFKTIQKLNDSTLEKIQLSFLGADSIAPLASLSTKVHKSSQIEMMTWQKDESLYSQWLYSLDLLLVPSRYENVCLSALEAISCGVPVLASPVGYMNNSIIENITGWLLSSPINEKEFIADFARKITQIVDSPHKLFLTSQSCQKYAKENFDMQKTVQGFLKILK